MSEDLTQLSERKLRRRLRGGLLDKVRSRELLPFQLVARAFATAELERRLHPLDLSRPTGELLELKERAEEDILESSQLASVLSAVGRGGNADLLVRDYQARYALSALESVVDERLSAPLTPAPRIRTSSLAERALSGMQPH